MRRSRTADVDISGGIKLSVLKTFLPYLMEHKARVFWALAFMALAKGASVTMPFILKYIVDDLTPSASETVKLLTVPVALLIAYGLVRFGMVFFGEIRDNIFGRVTERIIRKVALNVFEHLHSLDLGFHLDRKTGGLSRDIERGTSGISFLMRFMIFNIVPTLIEIGLVIGLLLYNYGIEFALIVAVSIACYIGYSVVATEWRTRYVREANKADSASNTLAVDSLLNFETVKYFNNERFEAGRYDVELDNLEQAKRKNRLTLFALNSGQALIIAIAVTVMMLLAAHRVSEGVMTLGDFVLINAFMMQLFIPLNFLGFVYREIKGSLANIERLFDLLKEVPSITDAKDARKPWTVSKGGIAFKGVNFHYNKDRQILDDVSFRHCSGRKSGRGRPEWFRQVHFGQATVSFLRCDRRRGGH